MQRFAADLPDPRIRLLPDLGDVVDDPADSLPVGRRQRNARASGLENRKQEFAVGIELSLLGGFVADTDGPRTTVARQLWQCPFGEVGVAVEPVQRLDVFGVGSPTDIQEPREVGAGFVRMTEISQCLYRERGVPNPVVAVVPVADAADLLRQRGRRGGGDRPGLVVGQQFEHQSRPDCQFVPRPAEHTVVLIGAGVTPHPPVVDRRVEGLFAARRRWLDSITVAEPDPLLLAIIERHHRGRPVVIDGEGLLTPGRPTQESLVGTGCENAIRGGIERCRAAGEIKPRFEDDLEVDVAVPTGEASVERPLRDAVRCCAERRHEIGECHRPGVCPKRRLQDVRPATVAHRRLEVVGWLHEELPTFGVEYAGKNAARFEMRHRKPVDRSVSAHECAGFEITDQAVVRERFERLGCSVARRRVVCRHMSTIGRNIGLRANQVYSSPNRESVEPEDWIPHVRFRRYCFV